MSSLSFNPKERGVPLRLAGPGALPAMERLLIYTSMIAAFAMLVCILIGVAG
jgi:hypothetical protein